MPTATPFPAVPIVGQQIAVHEAIGLATITCQCAADNPPLLIRGVDVAVACRRCRTAYAIVKLLFDRERGHQAVHIWVAAISRAPDEEKLQ